MCRTVQDSKFEIISSSFTLTYTHTLARAHTHKWTHTRHTPMHVKPESSSKKHHASSGQQAGPFRQLQRIGPYSSQSSRCLTRMLTRAGSYACLAACMRVCATLLDAALGRKCAHEPALKRQVGSDPGHEILSTPTQWPRQAAACERNRCGSKLTPTSSIFSATLSEVFLATFHGISARGTMEPSGPAGEPSERRWPQGGS